MDIFELRVLNPSTGVCDIVLPDLAEVTIAPMHSDVGTVQFTYPRRGLNFSQIQNDRELAVYYNGAEIGTLRSTIEQISYDDANLAEDGDLAKITTRMNISRLDRAIVYPPGWPTVTNPPDQTFTNATPGTIMLTLIAQAQTRGTIGYITTSSFTATHDSNGVAWATTITLTITAETDYLSLLQSLISYGLCEAQMNIYDLRLYNFQTLGVDHTTVEPPLILRKGRDMLQSQVQRQTKGLSTAVLMAGSANLYVEATDAGAIATRGRREIGASQNGVTDAGTLTSLGQTYLGTVSSEIVARTNQVNYGDPTTPLPLRDFNLGDWLYNDVADGNGLTRNRVIQWTFERKASGELVGNVVCDSIFQEKINRLNGILNAIMNGVTIIGSSQPAPVVKLLYPPKIPTGLAIGSSTYVDGQGITLAIANVTWNPVTQNTNNQTEANLQNYLVKYTNHGQSVWSLAAPIDPTVVAANFSPFNCGAVIDFQVGAIDDQGNFSGWSATVTQTMVGDTTPPNQPSTPSVSSLLGQLCVLWDGKDSGAAPMPGDFSFTRVHVSSSGSGFTPSPSNLMGTLQGAGSMVVGGSLLAYNTTYWVKLVAIDHSGNVSTASAAGSAVLVQVVNTDIGTGQVGLGSLSFSDVGNLVDNGSFEDPTWRTLRNTAFGGSHFAFDNTTASSGTWSVVHTGFSGGTEQVILSTITAKVGQVLMGAADIKMTSAVTSAMFVALGVNWLDKTGATIGSTVNLMTNWSTPSTNDNTWRTRISSSGQTAPANTVQAQIVLASTSHTAGSVWFDNVEVRMQMDNLLIADAAITNAKINDVSANKITAGTVQAGVILGASGVFGTGLTGQRVVLDSAGIHSYDSGGNKIFDLSNATTTITLAQSSTGPKVTIDVIGAYPTLRMYDSASSNNAFMNALNLGGNTASIGLNSGNYPTTTPVGALTFRNRLFMTNQIVLQVIDDTNAVNNGGQVVLTPTEAIFALAVEGTTHAGQLLFNQDFTHGDSSWELDGYISNDAAFSAQAYQGGDWTAIPAANTGLSWSFSQTMASNVSVVGTSLSISGTVIASNIQQNPNTTGSQLNIASTYPGLWSVEWVGTRIR